MKSTSRKKKTSTNPDPNPDSRIDTEDIYHLFVHWNALPPSTREPATIEEFCDKYGITLADTITFTERKSYYDDLEAEARSWGRAKLPELLHTLYFSIKSSARAQDIEIFRKLVTASSSGDGATYNLNIINPTDEQTRQIIEREARNAGLLSERGSS